jgi:hypothetical protein
VGDLDNFRQEGGAILIATDQHDNGWLSDLRLHVAGEKVTVAPSFRELGHLRNLECPVLRDFTAPEHPIFHRVTRVVTNRPSYLVPEPGCDLRLLAWFPPGCLAEGQVNQLPFIYGTEPQGKDRVLVLADHDVFVDGMILRNDLENFEFASDCVAWLADKGRRKYALLIDDGEVVSDFKVPLAELPMPLPPSKIISKMLRGLEEVNFFNAVLLEGVPRTVILRYLLLAASGWLLVYGLFRLVRAHHRTGTAARVAARVEKVVAPGLPLLTRRAEAVAGAGNCYEAARDLARLAFEGETGEPPAAPPAVLRGGRRLHREVERLWRLAYGATPTPVSPQEFASLAAMVARVRAALGRTGEW